MKKIQRIAFTALIVFLWLPQMVKATSVNVSTWSEFQTAINKYYSKGDTIRLTADIDLGGATNVTLFADEKIQNNWLEYQGVVDGGGHTISNGSLKKNRPLIPWTNDCCVMNLNFENISLKSNDYYGSLLVRFLKGGTFKNISFKNCSVTSTASGGNSALLAYHAGDAVIQNITAMDCTTKGNDGGFMKDEGSGAGLINGASGVIADNCHLTGMDVKGACFSGGIFGSFHYGKLTNCSFEGTFKGWADFDDTNINCHGGIAGSVSNAKITNCCVEGEIISEGDGLGGIVGRVGDSNTIIKDCVNRAYVHHNKLGGYDDILGGIVGQTAGSVIGCINYGRVDGGDNCIGGIAGKAVETAKIENCLNVGSVDGDDRVSGIVGYMTNNSSIDNCISIGTILINGHEKSGGCVDKHDSKTTVGRCYWKGDTGYNYQERPTQSSINDFDLTDPCFIWLMLNNSDDAGVWGIQLTTQGTALENYPTPNGASVYEHINGCNNYRYEFYNNNNSNHYGDMKLVDGDYQCSYCGASISYDDISSSPYYIRTTADLVAFANYVNGSGTITKAHPFTSGLLCNDIDCSSITSWAPIGTISNIYRGTFDGQGHTISNLDVSIANNDGIGMFGYVGNGAAIKNLTIDSSCSFTQTGGSTIKGVAAIAGCVYSDPNTDCNVTFENCGNEAPVKGIANVAGILGGVYNNSNSSVTFKNCYNTGDITGSKESAAICGWAYNNFSVLNCWNSGTISGITSGSSFIRFASSGTHILTNNFSTSAAQSNVTAFTADEVASGSLCYKLNGSEDHSDTGGWYQDMTSDEHPNVYNSGMYIYAHPNMWCDETVASFTQYTNDYNAPDVKHSYDDDGYCSRKSGETHYEAPELDNNKYCITKPAHLFWIAEQVNNENSHPNVKLMNNIVINDSLYVNGALTTDATKLAAMRVWTPIGTAAHPYISATFDGEGHTISGLYLPESANSTYAGLFGVACNSAVIGNLCVKDSYFYGSQYAGALVGCGVTPESLTDANGPSIIDCSSTGDVKSAGYAGGLAGYVGLTDLSERTYGCYSLCDVTSSDATKSGPLFGFLTSSSASYKGKLYSCYRTDKAVSGGTTYGQGYSELAFRLGSATEFLNNNICDNEGSAFWKQDLSEMNTPVPGDDNVYYSRDMTYQWGTVVVPYTLTSTDSIQYYNVKNIDTAGELHLKKTTTVAPNTPCFFYSAHPSTTVLLDDTQKDCTAPESTTITKDIDGADIMYVAFYDSAKVEPVEGQAYYYVAHDKMWRGDVTFEVPAFRVFLAQVVSSSTTAKSLIICVDGDDDSSTQIGEISSDGAITFYNGKFIENGQIVIRKDDKKYNVSGKEIR